MELDEVTAHARERLGMEIQAVDLLRARRAGGRAPEVWSLLTEHGNFWLVEGGGAIELFRATYNGPQPVQRFLELHPTGGPRPGALSPSTPQAPTPRLRAAPVLYDCRLCGVGVVTRQGTVLAERQQCRRCRHVEQERERYQNDPAYRARHLASRAAHSRRRREQDGS
jgi:hypothetical protein